MNASVRARRDARGFSFVELLVTILIAGIAFAAIVPLFVMAQGKNVDDNMRTISLNIARDKLERMRQLDYDSITVPNLNSTTFADGQFGTSWVAQSGTGSTKTMSIAYTVTNYPLGAADGSETYKQVQVSVGWTAPPNPVYPAVLSTIVYKQYAGPQIIGFDVGLHPLVLEEVSNDVNWITSSPTSLDVYISPSDIGLMIPLGETNKLKWGYIQFAVTSINGIAIDGADVTDPVVGEPGHYQWSWNNVNAPDGIYVLQAVAYSSGKQQGNAVSVAYMVAVKVPPAPTNLRGTVGDKRVSLTWDASPIGDFGHYELWRMVGAAGTWALVSDTLTVANYTDTAVTNGTQYYYRVRVVDTEVPANTSAFSAVAGPLVPAVQADTVAPSTPNPLTATAVAGAQSIQLSWPLSTDGGTPASGVRGYNVQRSTDNVNWSQILSADAFNQLSYLDVNVGWATRRYYRVQAVDVAGNASAWSPVASATTMTRPLHSLIVNNTSGSTTVYIRVQSSTTGLYWNTNGSSQASAPTEVQIKKNKSTTWTNLPEDNYNVFGRYSATATPKNTQWSSDPWSVSFP